MNNAAAPSGARAVLEPENTARDASKHAAMSPNPLGDAIEQVLLGAEHGAIVARFVDGAVDPFPLGFQAA